MKTIRFRLAVWTEAAGKYNPDAPLEGNEDNYYIDDNLMDDIPGHFVQDESIELSQYGCIMAVADGMGGMNAGEVASEIAIKTVSEYFSPDKITDNIVSTPESRAKYLEKIIVDANRRIINDAKEYPEHEGMGSTLILAWLVENQLTVSWIGDSRCYRFNPKNGIEPLSEDHSYVQDLVKQGILRYEQTFGHPQGNIVTKSLGDDSHKCQPETRQFEVCNQDIILLCSDGLSGVLRDCKTYDENDELYPGDNLEDIISDNSHSMVTCREKLFEAAERAGWYDNVTAILCQIESGANEAPDNKKRSTATTKVDVVSDQKVQIRKTFWQRTLHIKTKDLFSILAVFLIVVIIGVVGGIYYFSRDTDLNHDQNNSQTVVGNFSKDLAIQPDETVCQELKNLVDKAIVGLVNEINNPDNLKLVSTDDLRKKLDISEEISRYDSAYYAKVIDEISDLGKKIKKPLSYLKNAYKAATQEQRDQILQLMKALVDDPSIDWRAQIEEIVGPKSRGLVPKQKKENSEENTTEKEDEDFTELTKIEDTLEISLIVTKIISEGNEQKYFIGSENSNGLSSFPKTVQEFCSNRYKGYTIEKIVNKVDGTLIEIVNANAYDFEIGTELKCTLKKQK